MHLFLAVVGLLPGLVSLLPAALATPGKPSLDQTLADLVVPPPWLDAVPLDVVPSTPWNKVWDRIEELLMTANPVLFFTGPYPLTALPARTRVAAGIPSRALPVLW